MPCVFSSHSNEKAKMKRYLYYPNEVFLSYGYIIGELI